MVQSVAHTRLWLAASVFASPTAITINLQSTSLLVSVQTFFIHFLHVVNMFRRTPARGSSRRHALVGNGACKVTHCCFIDGEVLFQDVAPLDQPGAITQYTQIDMPRGNVTVRVTKAGTKLLCRDRCYCISFISSICT